MAKGVKFGGGIDTDYWNKQIKNIKTKEDARNLLSDIMDASTAGLFNIGITSNDQKNIVGLIKNLGKKAGVDTSNIEAYWDPKVDLKSKNVDTIMANSLRLWDKQIEAQTKKESEVKAQQQKDKATTDKINDVINGATKAIKNAAKSIGGSGSSGGSKSNDRYYQNQLKELKKEIDALKKPKVWSAQELAELYGITDQYNMANIEKQYNDATNQYYDDAIKQQEQYNEDANFTAASYANNLIRKYVDSYKAQAPTAVGRGTLAANALTNSLAADQTLGETATNLNNIINDYKAQREAELAQNPINARTDYNNIGSWLLSQGANMNASDVQQYIDTLNAYKDKYTAARNAQATLANAAASAYQNRAQAALANMQYANNNSLWKYYQLIYGDNAATAYGNDMYSTYRTGDLNNSTNQ